MEEHTLHLVRHLAARHSLLVGQEVDVVGADDTAIVGNGLFPDGQAHLLPEEYLRGLDIGKHLYLPKNLNSVLQASSQLIRAIETNNALYLGLVEEFAARVNVTPGRLSPEHQQIQLKHGLNKITTFKVLNGLTETVYRNFAGCPDDGNELVAQAYNKTVNPNFPGYRWMVQKGFQEDQRSEEPRLLARRGLQDLLPNLTNYDVVIATTHQPNMEIITAALTGNIGQDANELFENAGGAYGMGGRLELKIYTEGMNVVDAKMMRSLDNPRIAEMEMNVDINVIKSYL
tara:strand:- start:43419 stop:44279 length:861 start_codon:yes stop_codon:yes gene_type:complete